MSKRKRQNTIFPPFFIRSAVLQSLFFFAMDDPEVQNKLKKYKLRVKLWEKDFKSKFGRIPSKVIETI